MLLLTVRVKNCRTVKLWKAEHSITKNYLAPACRRGKKVRLLIVGRGLWTL